MTIQLTKLRIIDLEVGMFVEKMDCPAFDSPFSPQGFAIRNQKEITELDNFCQFVWVNLKKSATLKALNQGFSLEPLTVSPLAALPLGGGAGTFNSTTSKTVKRTPKAIKKHSADDMALLPRFLLSFSICASCAIAFMCY